MAEAAYLLPYRCRNLFSDAQSAAVRLNPSTSLVSQRTQELRPCASTQQAGSFRGGTQLRKHSPTTLIPGRRTHTICWQREAIGPNVPNPHFPVRQGPTKGRHQILNWGQYPINPAISDPSYTDPPSTLLPSTELEQFHAPDHRSHFGRGLAPTSLNCTNRLFARWADQQSEPLRDAR